MDYDSDLDGADGEHNEYADMDDDKVAPEYNVKDSVLFMIDARKSMCDPGPGGSPSCFVQAMQCVLACQRDGVLGRDRDLIGVLLFGTEETKVPAGQASFEHVYVLQELDEPSAAAMRTTSLVISAEEEAKEAHGHGAPEENAPAGGEGGGGAPRFGHADAAGVDLEGALWMASILFNGSAAKNTRRRIYLMTNDDAPYDSSGGGAAAAARARALTRSRDLQQSHVWIEPFFFSPSASRSFDLSEASFWRELIGGVRHNYRPPPSVAAGGGGGGGGGASTSAAATGGGVGDGEAETAVATTTEALEEDTSERWLSTCVASDPSAMLERVRRTAHRKRVLWSSSLTVRPGYALSFVMVSIVRPAARPAATKLDARTNEPLQSATTYLCKTHGTAVRSADVFKAFNFGGKWAYFDGHELSGLGREGGLGDAGITLLGFQDASTLKLHHNVGPSKFLQPTDACEGSVEAMGALVARMHARGKIAIGRMCKNRNSHPKLVALLPQLPSGRFAEAMTAAAQQHGHGHGHGTLVAAAPPPPPRAPLPPPLVDVPAGLHMIELPLAEDIRSVAKPPALSATEFAPAQLDAARALVRTLTLPPDASPVGTVSNPAALTHFNYVQMLALAVPGDEAAPIADGTRPGAAWLANAADEMGAFRDAFDLPTSEEVHAAAAAPAKRQKTAAAPAVKLAPPSTLGEWVAAHLQGRLREMTNPTLKAFCKERGLPVSGKKDELLARAEAFLERAMEDDATLKPP